MYKTLTADEIRELIQVVVKSAFLFKYQESVDAEGSIIAAFDTQAERIAELEAQVQSFINFNAPLLRMVAGEEPGAWDHLQGD